MGAKDDREPVFVLTQRTCRKCGATKPISEFGVMRSNADNTDHICKACRREITRSYKGRIKEEPWSTAEARRILLKFHNIPCVTGSACDKAGIDLMAWACVPIEAKSSKPTYMSKAGAQTFEFAFSRTQVNRGIEGLVMLITRLHNKEPEWYLLPGDDGIIVGKAHVTVTVDSPTSPYWKLLQPYYRKIELIEVMRQNFFETGFARLPLEYRRQLAATAR